MKENTYPEYFVDSNCEYRNMNWAVNNFNNFFVNVGPDLEAKIPEEQIMPYIEKNG